MKRLKDFSEADWFLRPLAENRENRESKGFTKVENFIPHKFQAYGKILHRIHIDEGFEKTGKEKLYNPPKNLGNSPLDQAIKIVTETAIFSHTTAYPDAAGKTITWEELCKEYDIPYVGEIDFEAIAKFLHKNFKGWPDYILGPCEGSFDFEEFRILLKILHPFAKSKKYFLYNETMTAGRLMEPYEPTFKDEIFTSSFPELMEIWDKIPGGMTPNFLWPENCSWLLTTDYDCTFSFIGGSKELIQTIIEANLVECLEVTPGTRPHYHNHGVLN